MYDIHTKFLGQLLKVCSDRTLRISKTFLQFKESFLVYGEYCANLTQACTILQDACMKDEKVNEALTVR